MPSAPAPSAALEQRAGHFRARGDDSLVAGVEEGEQLDEPVAHLDGPTARAVMQHLGTATAGRSVVLVSHRTEGHEWCGAEVRLESLVDARR